MKSALYFFLFFFITFFNGQTKLLPFFKNYPKSIYNGENQNWSCTQDKNGNIFFANNHYLLKYNGVNWMKFQLPEKTIIRSVYAQGDSIFCGSYKDFGYWKNNNQNQLEYYSLTKDKKLFQSNDSEEIWKVFAFKNSVYFQSFNNIYILKNKKIKKIHMPENIIYAYVVDNQLLISGSSGRIFSFNNNVLTIKYNFPLLLNKTIHSIHKINNEIWFFTFKDGVFILKENQIQSLKNPLNDFLKKSLINTVYHFQNNKLLFGTVNNGLIMFDYNSQSLIVLDRNNGLLNNSIIQIFKDKEDNIWLGLDNGISFIELNSPITVLNDSSGKLGSVYNMKKMDENSFLLASNHGLFKYENEKIDKISNYDGQMWHIFPVGTQYICGANDGTYVYENNVLKKLNNINGGWNFKKLPYENNYIQSTYTGLYLYKKVGSEWETKQITKIQLQLKNISTIVPNYIFAVDIQKGIYAVKYDSKFSTFQTINITENNKIKDDYNCSLIELNNNIYFLINKKWYEFNFLNNKLQQNKLLNEKLKNVSEIYNISENQLIVINDSGTYILNLEAGNFKFSPIQEKYYFGKLIPNFISTESTSNTTYFTMDDGFISMYSINHKIKLSKLFFEIEMDNVPTNIETTIPYNHSKLKLNVLTGIFGYFAPNLYYKDLDTSEFISLKNNQIDLSSLKSGNYQIEIYQDLNNKFIKVAVASIKVAYPWYLSFWMLLFYITFISFCIYAYYKITEYKTKQKLRFFEEETKHKYDMEMLEQIKETEKAQLSLEKQSLELDFNIKSSELASKALLLAKYNEVVEELSNIVQNNDDTEIRKKITKVLQKNKIGKEWKVFETNINLVHNVFIKRLLEQFPELTPKDIQLAVFLRMNLSSKEIAPLFSISFRGVEIHRYRLRKKMNLDPTTNLSKYMINF